MKNVISNYLSSLIVMLCFSAHVYAAPPPPWIATVKGEALSFPSSDCVSSAVKTLQRQGFARVTPQGEKVFAALQAGKTYGYKAVVQCLPQYQLVTVTVVAQRKGGLNKARAILAALSQRAVPQEIPDAETLEEDKTGFPDCSDGPTLMRCLNSTPPDSLGLAIEYLRQRTESED